MKTIQQLTLVLMNSLHVDIKHGVRIHLDPMGGFKIGGKLLLVLLKMAYRSRGEGRRKGGEGVVGR